jgi:hypothetical protein
MALTRGPSTEHCIDAIQISPILMIVIHEYATLMRSRRRCVEIFNGLEQQWNALMKTIL